MTTNEDTIKRYFAAWEAGETEFLEEIFMPDAHVVVYSGPAEEYAGLADIGRQWDKRAALQIHPKPRVLHKLVGYHRVFVEWQCDYATLEGNSNHEQGVFVLEFKDGRIAELRQYSAVRLG